MTDKLVLGNIPGPLTVNITLGDPWRTDLILKDNGVPIAWPAAPVLEFTHGSLDLPATLGPDLATSTPDAQATWTMTEAQVNGFADGDRTHVRLSVDGATYWSGHVSCRS